MRAFDEIPRAPRLSPDARVKDTGDVASMLLSAEDDAAPRSRPS